MNQVELLECKRIAMQYADPIRGKMLALITQVELLDCENEKLRQQILKGETK